jgi:hypothetical protein
MMHRNRLLILVAICLSVTHLHAQDRGRRSETPQPAILKAYVPTQTARIEGELATLIQKRAETPAAAMAYHEMRIDLRIVQRWLVSQLLAAEPYSDLQAVLWLRHRDLDGLISTVDSWATTQTANPSRIQSEAMGKLSKATYDLKPVDSVAGLDGFFTALRSPLLIALGDATGKAQDMRPALPKRADQPDKPEAEPTEPPTLDQLSNQITRLAISIPLRQQLLSAVAATRAAEKKEQEEMLSMLRSAVELSSALQSNVGVDAASRSTIETQLGEAVSLFSDPRLRDSAQERLKGLSQYRQLAGRVSSLALSPEFVLALAPAFEYARSQPDQSGKVLGAIETFAQFEQQLPAIKPAAASDAVGRAAEAQFKQLLNLRAGFMEDAGKLKVNSAFASTPDDLSRRIDQMKQSMELLEVLKRLPQTQATLVQLKPRPTGALERRITQSLVKLDSDSASRNYLVGLDALATAYSNASQALAERVDEAVVQKYAGTTWEKFESHIKQSATDSASAAAVSGAVDSRATASIQQTLAVVERLRTLATLDARLTIDAPINRWADCSLGQEKLTSLLDQYRSDFAQVVTDTLAGKGDAESAAGLRGRYRGLFRTLEQIASVADACVQLPSGAMGQVGSLTTPSDKAPFGRVRFLSYMTDLLDLTRSSAEADLSSVETLETRMLEGLGR